MKQIIQCLNKSDDSVAAASSSPSTSAVRNVDLVCNPVRRRAAASPTHPSASMSRAMEMITPGSSSASWDASSPSSSLPSASSPSAGSVSSSSPSAGSSSSSSGSAARSSAGTTVASMVTSSANKFSMPGSDMTKRVSSSG